MDVLKLKKLRGERLNQTDPRIIQHRLISQRAEWYNGDILTAR
jgi:hypothetical protein